MRLDVPTLVVLALAGLGCGHNAPAGPSDSVVAVTMEQGGACVGTDPCWWRTTVTAPGTIRLENFKQGMDKPLPPADYQRVLAIVDSREFRAAIESEAPVCPVTFDGDIIISLQTSAVSRTDKHASGCVLDTEGVPKHPYRDLFRLLDRLRREQFPGVLPF